MAQKLEQLTDCLQRRLFVELEASGRHVHLTKDHIQTLFGHDLTPAKPLSQPGQFAAKERVSVRGPKGELHHVAVLGPDRPQTQVEISLTDGRALGIQPPIRLSGDVAGTPGCTITGPNGSVTIDHGVIVAQRHIHMSQCDAALQNVHDGQVVRLKALTARPVVFEDVAVRVHPQFSTAVHLDYDEANACGFRTGDLGMILK
ncbi:MAG: phosphate propanoyltransferase [Oscillospiraceae bacterium]|nr:phosphate propanoyltransferase [Oscillospiraceae bacterium]